jgi:3-hydroxyisobutyrate dehydrogenase-like beta-hydroxyacid dehydrogenase
MIGGNFAPSFALRLGFKDVELALDAARERHLELPVTRAL